MSNPIGFAVLKLFTAEALQPSMLKGVSPWAGFIKVFSVGLIKLSPKQKWNSQNKHEEGKFSPFLSKGKVKQLF